MRLTRTGSILLVLSVVLGCASPKRPISAQSREDPEVVALRDQLKSCPPEIVQLAIDIRGKSPYDIQGILTKRLGKPSGHLPTGVSAIYWNCYSGTVLSWGWSIPTYTNASGKRFWLMLTHNSVEPTLFEEYWMFTPQPVSERIRLGDLTLNSDRTYRFCPDDNFTKQTEQGKRNFFQVHPKGTFTILYRKGIKKDMLLESIGEDTILCDLTFRSKEGRARISYPIRNWQSAKMLCFANCDQEFVMNIGWPDR